MRSRRRLITGAMIVGWFGLALLLFSPAMTRPSSVSVAVDLPAGADAEATGQVVNALVVASTLIGPLIALLILFGAAALVYLYARKREEKEPPP